MKFNFAEFKQDLLFALSEYPAEVKELLNTDYFRVAEINAETNATRWLTKTLLFSEHLEEGWIFSDLEANAIITNLRSSYSNSNSNSDKVAYFLELCHYASRLTKKSF